MTFDDVKAGVLCAAALCSAPFEFAYGWTKATWTGACWFGRGVKTVCKSIACVLLLGFLGGAGYIYYTFTKQVKEVYDMMFSSITTNPITLEIAMEDGGLLTTVLGLLV